MVQTEFVYLDIDFAINLIRPNFAKFIIDR